MKICTHPVVEGGVSLVRFPASLAFGSGQVSGMGNLTRDLQVGGRENRTKKDKLSKYDKHTPSKRR